MYSGSVVAENAAQGIMGMHEKNDFETLEDKDIE